MASLPRRVGYEPGERQRMQCQRRLVLDDPSRDEIGAAVVVERDQLRRRARGALEARVVGVRGLMPAVASADGPLRRSALAVYTRGRPVNPDWRRYGLLAEQGDADHADVFGPAGARGIRVGKRGEVERRRLAEVPAPALDVHAAARREHVAALRRIGGLPGDDIDAVDRHYRQQIFLQAIAQRHL